MRKFWLFSALAATSLLLPVQAAQAKPQIGAGTLAVTAHQRPVAADDVHSGADRYFGFGGAWFKFTGDSTIEDIWTYANDTSCDGNNVYARLEVKHANGHVEIADDTTARGEGCMGGTGHTEDVSYQHIMGAISWARVILCNDDWGPTNTCVRGPKRDNPEF